MERDELVKTLEAFAFYVKAGRVNVMATAEALAACVNGTASVDQRVGLDAMVEDFAAEVHTYA